MPDRSLYRDEPAAAKRRPGLPWRVLAHRRDGTPVEMQSRDHGDPDFDELVVGQWIHLEQMSKRRWWMNVGGVTVWIRVTKDGRPKKVTVYGPNNYASPADGCAYELAWDQS